MKAARTSGPPLASNPDAPDARTRLIAEGAMGKRGHMRLGMSLRGIGYHPAAWLHPDVPPDGTLRFQHYVRTAQAAERGKIDMIFFADGIGIRERDEPRGSLARSGYELVEMEPMTLLPALAPVTRNIGLVTTASTTYNEPYHIARKFATLDLISGGRAGWNVVTSWSDAEAHNFNRAQHLDYDTRYERAAEFVEVVKGLWDSWEDDALIYDRRSRVFYDESRMHLLNHKGRHFAVKGPLNVAGMPQGRPILFQAGASDPGREIAAATADVVYASQSSLPEMRAYYDDVKGRMAKYGRHPHELLILPGVRILTAPTRAEAQAKLDQLQDLLDPLVGLARVYAAMGDLSAHDLDGPVPDPVRPPQVRSSTERIMKMARAENLTIRQLYKRITAGGFCLVGTPTDVADGLQEWFEAGVCDGFNVLPTHLPVNCDEFVDMVVPELQRRNLFRAEYEGPTLRENLGLARPVNRHTQARRQQAAE